MKLQQPEEDEIQLNLIPIMNLFTALIPFLLLSAAFYHLSMIQISVPTQSESGETDVAKEEDKITLNLQIKPDAFVLSASSDTIGPDILAKLKETVPRVKGEPNRRDPEDKVLAAYQQLSQSAFRIKGDYASSDTVMVVADDKIPYEEVVFALDAVRDVATDRGGQKVRVQLFPRAVLSSLVK